MTRIAAAARVRSTVTSQRGVVARGRLRTPKIMNAPQQAGADLQNTPGVRRDSVLRGKSSLRRARLYRSRPWGQPRFNDSVYAITAFRKKYKRQLSQPAP